MRLTKEQQMKVNDNIRLVQKVINDKVHGSNQLGIYSYDDIFQIGCIGLCKAVATDKGGTFSTYAYRLIWNEICDALIYSTRRQTTEVACDVIPIVVQDNKLTIDCISLRLDLNKALQKAQEAAPPCVVKGIKAILLMSQGYTSREVGDELGVSAKLVCAWVSKARKFLKERSDIKALQKYKI